jgi:hypothetical protein
VTDPRSYGSHRSTHLPVNWRLPFASSKIGRMSLMPTAVALSSLKIAFVCLAMRRASVVLPQLRPVAVSPAHYTSMGCKTKRTYPGGPHRIMLPTAPLSVRAERKEPGPVRWAWPTNSSSVLGRSRSANGDAACRRDPMVPVGLVCLINDVLACVANGLEEASPDSFLF